MVLTAKSSLALHFTTNLPGLAWYWNYDLDWIGMDLREGAVKRRKLAHLQGEVGVRPASTIY